MARHCSAKDLFRQMPNALLARYFQGRSVFSNLDFSTMKETKSAEFRENGWASVEKALNHTIGGLRGVYNRAEYADQRREMLQLRADFIEKLVNDKNVILGRFVKAA